MMRAIILLLAGLVSAFADESPVYPQVRFQPLRNVLVLPTSEQLNELSKNSTKEQEPKTKDVKPEEKQVVSMDELRTVEGSVTGSYHVLLENGKLQKVEYTAAPKLPIRQQVVQEPEVRSWYYTQVPADILQRYYAEYYSQQQNADYTRKPSSNNQISSSNSQGFSQSSGSGPNQASNHNVQVFNQGKRGLLISSQFQSAASQQSSQRVGAPSQSVKSGSTSQNNGPFNSEQRVRSREEVETFEPVQSTRVGQSGEGYQPNGVIATIYYSDVNPITGPVYTFDQTPLIRILRQA